MFDSTYDGNRESTNFEFAWHFKSQKNKGPHIWTATSSAIEWNFIFSTFVFPFVCVCVYACRTCVYLPARLFFLFIVYSLWLDLFRYPFGFFQHFIFLQISYGFTLQSRSVSLILSITPTLFANKKHGSLLFDVVCSFFFTHLLYFVIFSGEKIEPRRNGNGRRAEWI